MARHPETFDVVEEIESGAERLAGWVAANLWLSVGIALGVLALVGAVGGYASWKSSSEESASDALDRVRSEYLREMGASPSARWKIRYTAAGDIIASPHYTPAPCPAQFFARAACAARRHAVLAQSWQRCR